MMRPEKGEYTLKPELEKPKYTTWQNTIYMLRKMWGWSKKDILISLLHIPPSVISPLIRCAVENPRGLPDGRGDARAADHNGGRRYFNLRRMLLAG